MRRFVSRTTALLGADAAALAVLRPHWAALGNGLRHPEAWLAAGHTDAALAQLSGALLWCAGLWVGLGLLAGIGAHLPGAAGRTCARAARATLPRIVLRVALGSTGLGLVAGPAVVLPAAATTLPATQQATAHASAFPAAPVAATPLVPAASWPTTAPTSPATPVLSWPGATPTVSTPLPAPSGSTSSPVSSAPAAGQLPAPSWPTSTPASAPSAVPLPAPSWPTSTPASAPPAVPLPAPSWPTSTPAPAASTPAASTPAASTPAASPVSPRPAPTDLPTGPRGPVISAPRPATPAPQRSSTARVRAGDSLWLIAARRLAGTASPGRSAHDQPGDDAVATYWPRIYAANRGAVGDDPSLIHPGQVLHLPPPTPQELP